LHNLYTALLIFTGIVLLIEIVLFATIGVLVLGSTTGYNILRLVQPLLLTVFNNRIFFPFKFPAAKPVV